MTRLLDVCICTHNPRRSILDVVIKSLARQTVDQSLYRILIVDNSSSPPLQPGEFTRLYDAGISFTIVREPMSGISHARARAIAETDGEWILFVDDDNELELDYIANGLKIIENQKNLGCFGGRLILPSYLKPPRWMSNLLPYLAIRDNGNEPITNMANYWGQWEPPTAGAFVHRSLLDLYLHKTRENPLIHRLGRRGTKILSSCEDSLMMRGACEVDRFASYQPSLILYHHLDPRRFTFSYMRRLMYAYGKSHVVLESLLGTMQDPPPYYAHLSAVTRLIGSLFMKNIFGSLRHAVCMVFYHLGAYVEWKQRRQLPN
jgi:glycosyltransferase involved in cell wall biosynthesis